MRVNEIAKELNLSNKDLIAKCKEMGIKTTKGTPVTSHSNSLPEDQAEWLKSSFQGARRMVVIDPETIARRSGKPKPKTGRFQSRGPKTGDNRGGKPDGNRGNRPDNRNPRKPGVGGNSSRTNNQNRPDNRGSRPNTSGNSRPPRSGGANRGSGFTPNNSPIPAVSEKSTRKVDKPNKSKTGNGSSPRFLSKKGKGGGRPRSDSFDSSDRGFKKKKKQHNIDQEKVIPEITGPVDVTVPISVREFSQIAGIKVNQIIAHLMKTGVMVNINQYLGADEVLEIGVSFDREVNIIEESDALEELENREVGAGDEATTRPPVVTILGHVDHGKTSLLDRIRSANVQEKEAGGITQHISSYRITHNGFDIAFVDTPGHAAFTEMRARGANVTDIVLLIVAADDGVMPQTIESINHAKAAKVPLIVVINKCDLQSANLDKVKQELSTQNLLIEEWGGDTLCVEVSAQTGQGVDSLLEMIQLQSEMLELKANHNAKAFGLVMESELSQGLGAVTRMIVRDGTLKVGDNVVCGSHYGKIKTIYNDQGVIIKTAGPSTPIAVTGMTGTPDAGQKFIVVESIQKAKELAGTRLERDKVEDQFKRQSNVTLESLAARIKDQNLKSLRVILKADVMGSLEVINKALNDIIHDEVKVEVIHKAVGGINESDITLAEASDAIILGFHVTASSKARDFAKNKGVDLRTYQVVYELLDEVKASLSGMLTPDKIEKIIGHVEVRKVFKGGRIGTIAGCYVTDGVVTRDALIRITRDGIVIFDGAISSLNRFKDSVKEVRQGYECGVGVDGYNDIKEGDILEAIAIEEVKKAVDL